MSLTSSSSTISADAGDHENVPAAVHLDVVVAHPATSSSASAGQQVNPAQPAKTADLFGIQMEVSVFVVESEERD
jgi:hypothetical protein